MLTTVVREGLLLLLVVLLQLGLSQPQSGQLGSPSTSSTTSEAAAPVAVESGTVDHTAVATGGYCLFVVNSCARGGCCYCCW